MKRSFIFVVMLLFSGLATAEVRINSFYFDKNGVELTGTSRCLLDELQLYMSTHEVQIIEINAFSDIEGDQKSNSELAKKRLEFIINFLEVDDENIIINTYGAKKVKLNFTPINWHRVDVYYYLGDRKQFLIVEEIIDQPIVQKKDSLEAVPTIIQNQPIVLPIKFEGGSYIVQQESYEYLEKLYASMVVHPQLHAHIRGHVCCGKNKHKSKKRAKVVYKYLKQKGISKKRLSFKGYSNSEPLIFPEVTNEDRSANRRVDIIFFSQKRNSQ